MRWLNNEERYEIPKLIPLDFRRVEKDNINIVWVVWYSEWVPIVRLLRILLGNSRIRMLQIEMKFIW